MRASFRKNTTVYEKPMIKTLNITFSMFINLCFEARLSLHLQNLCFLLAIKVGPYAETPVAIGLRSRSSMWTWSSGEPVSFNQTHVKTVINDYDSEVHPCHYKYCGVLRVYATVDIRFFDRCCNNIPKSFVCSMVSLL